MKDNAAALKILFIYVLFFSLAFLIAPKTGLAADAYLFDNVWPNLSQTSTFNTPEGVAVDSTGNFYVTDSLNDRVKKYDASGNYLFAWGNHGTNDGQFDHPFGIAVDANGYVFVVDTYNNRIQKFNSAGVFQTKWGTIGSANGQFLWPVGVTVDADGYVYVADTFNERIQKFNSAGVFQVKWGTFGNGNSQFYYPTDVAVDSIGNVFVVDSFNNRIQKFTTNGAYKSEWGSPGTGYGQFNAPFGITVDTIGNVYIVDRNNNRIQKFDQFGNGLTAWGSLGAGVGKFNTPGDIAVDSSGHVYVVDTDNNRIQKFVRDPGFTSVTAWSSSSAGGWDISKDKLAVGDFNQDGFSDIVSIRNYPSEHRVKAWVWLNDGSGHYGAPQIWWDSGPGNWDWAGSKLAVGDFDYNYKDDLVVFYGYFNERQTRAFVFTTGTGKFNNPVKWWDSGPGNWDWAGTKLQAGDYNGDGSDDLAAFYGYAAQSQARAFVFFSNGGSFSNATTWWDSGPGNWDIAGTKLAGGDFNNDGQDDLLAFYGYSNHRTKAIVLKAGTNKFTAKVWWDSGPGNWDWAGTKLTIGTFDNNAGSDIAALYGYSGNRTRLFVLSADPVGEKFKPADTWWDSGPGNWNWAAATIFSGNISGKAYIMEFLGFYNYGGTNSNIFEFK